MPNGTTILACSGYFPGCQRPHLTETKKAEVVEDDSAAGFIEVTFAGGAFV